MVLLSRAFSTWVVLLLRLLGAVVGLANILVLGFFCVDLPLFEKRGKNYVRGNIRGNDTHGVWGPVE